MHFTGYLLLAATFTCLMQSIHLHPDDYDSSPPPEDYLIISNNLLPVEPPEGASDDSVRTFFNDGGLGSYRWHLPVLPDNREKMRPFWKRSKKVLGVFTKGRPSLYVKPNSNTGSSEFLNTYVRGHFGLSRYTFDRPRPLRWG
ncbi:uncharacterized protein LOC129963847 [Argiope bruennichi]|uniref:uncharacterized protein LOC129963847 n=1 Tax=Argiope bruennichi TaxID=94029 RepID=UPI0024954B91|nr:uncharacterized protein LOC129963847 [Argiope bruennichi]